MKDLEALNSILSRIAPDGKIGHPNGVPSAAYIRVSTEEQAKEGASGLPRQIERIHEIAIEKGLTIPIDQIYADDSSGFDFETRNELTRLRRQYENGSRPFGYVVMEHVDRLSRNVKWHQGFLLEEMIKHGVKPVFWNEFRSEFERVILGTIAQDGMERSKQIMKEGMRNKAKDGRVTAKRAAFGYRFADKDGQERDMPGRHTYYKIHEPEAVVVRMMFAKLACECLSLRAISKWLLENHPFGRNWNPSKVRDIIVSRLYMGEFIHGRERLIKTPKHDRQGNFIRMSQHHIMTPESEWIYVEVPPIVDAGLWNAAQEALKQNAATASRNAKHEYLLTGVIRCALCGSAMTGAIHRGTRMRKKTKEVVPNISQSYKCSKKMHREWKACQQKTIITRKIDDAVWQALVSMMLEPERIVASLDRKLTSERNTDILNQIEHIETRIADFPRRLKRIDDAYEAGAYDPTEYTEKRRQIAAELSPLARERGKLQMQIVTPEQIAEQKSLIAHICETAREHGLDKELPFALKKRVIKLMVDKVTLHTIEGWFSIEGVINNTFCLEKAEDCVGSSPNEHQG